MSKSNPLFRNSTPPQEVFTIYGFVAETFNYGVEMFTRAANVEEAKARFAAKFVGARIVAVLRGRHENLNK